MYTVWISCYTVSHPCRKSRSAWHMRPPICNSSQGRFTSVSLLLRLVSSASNHHSFRVPSFHSTDGSFLKHSFVSDSRARRRQRTWWWCLPALLRSTASNFTREPVPIPICLDTPLLDPPPRLVSLESFAAHKCRRILQEAAKADADCQFLYRIYYRLRPRASSMRAMLRGTPTTRRRTARTGILHTTHPMTTRAPGLR